MKLAVLAAGAVCLAALGSTAPALAQDAPEKIVIAEFSCRDLLALSDEEREFGLLYYTGYIDGKSGAAEMNDDKKGDLSDKVLNACLDDPKTTVLAAFEAVMK
jgi:hypothetical protein